MVVTKNHSGGITMVHHIYLIDDENRVREAFQDSFTDYLEDHDLEEDYDLNVASEPSRLITMLTDVRRDKISPTSLILDVNNRFAQDSVEQRISKGRRGAAVKTTLNSLEKAYTLPENSTLYNGVLLSIVWSGEDPRNILSDRGFTAMVERSRENPRKNPACLYLRKTGDIGMDILTMGDVLQYTSHIHHQIGTLAARETLSESATRANNLLTRFRQEGAFKSWYQSK